MNPSRSISFGAGANRLTTLDTCWTGDAPDAGNGLLASAFTCPLAWVSQHGAPSAGQLSTVKILDLPKSVSDELQAIKAPD